MYGRGHAMYQVVRTGLSGRRPGKRVGGLRARVACSKANAYANRFGLGPGGPDQRDTKGVPSRGSVRHRNPGTPRSFTSCSDLGPVVGMYSGRSASSTRSDWAQRLRKEEPIQLVLLEHAAEEVAQLLPPRLVRSPSSARAGRVGGAEANGRSPSTSTRGRNSSPVRRSHSSIVWKAAPSPALGGTRGGREILPRAPPGARRTRGGEARLLEWILETSATRRTSASAASPYKRSVRVSSGNDRRATPGRRGEPLPCK